MALSYKIKKDLKGKIEPRPQGTVTPTGLLKVAEGTVMCRQKEEKFEKVDTQQADAQMAEMEAAFQQQSQVEAPVVNATKKRSRKKALPEKNLSVNATITVLGLGSVPSVYAYICMGEGGVALLGLTPMSFVPQATDVTQTPLTNVFQVSAFGDAKFVHMGNIVRTPDGINNLVIYQLE